MPVTARTYVSPTLVLLAFDYPEGEQQSDFLGFAIRRTPGFNSAEFSYLPNRVGFAGPPADGSTQGSDRWPIQKFYWWDANITTADRGKTAFTYTIQPVTGSPDQMTLGVGIDVQAAIPETVVNGIGTYFNRAVVSSQAFVSKFGHQPTGDKLHAAYQWLGNGMEQVIADFLQSAKDARCDVEGAIYHLSQSDQGEFIIPAMAAFRRKLSLVDDAHKNANANAIRQLQPAGVEFLPRTKTHIMHDKFLVQVKGDRGMSLVMGSANYTTEGLTTQANLMHTFESPELAQLYLQRKRLLEGDPTIAVTASNAAWSDPVTCGDATLRVFFPPEKKTAYVSIQAVINAVKRANKSVVFCLFDPTDHDLLDAFFGAANAKKMMFGLINQVPEEEPKPNQTGRVDSVKVEIYDRSAQSKQLELAGHEAFRRGNTPQGFSWEDSSLGPGGPYPVYIHHKFIVVDGETESPTIYTGSANMSGNSVHGNDENLLEITNCPRLGQLYLAEFLRLFEHYRARLAFETHRSGDSGTFQLTKDNSWSKDWYEPGSKANSRVAMAQPLSGGATGSPAVSSPAKTSTRRGRTRKGPGGRASSRAGRRDAETS